MRFRSTLEVDVCIGAAPLQLSIPSDLGSPRGTQYVASPSTLMGMHGDELLAIPGLAGGTKASWVELAGSPAETGGFDAPSPGSPLLEPPVWFVAPTAEPELEFSVLGEPSIAGDKEVTFKAGPGGSPALAVLLDPGIFDEVALRLELNSLAVADDVVKFADDNGWKAVAAVIESESD